MKSEAGKVRPRLVGYKSGRPRGRPTQYPGLTKHTLMLLEPHRRFLTDRGDNWSELVRAAVIVCYGSPSELRTLPAEYQRAIALQAEVAARLVPTSSKARARRSRGTGRAGTARKPASKALSGSNGPRTGRKARSRGIHAKVATRRLKAKKRQVRSGRGSQR